MRGKVLGFGGKNYRYRPLRSLFEVSAGSLNDLATGGPEARHSTPLAWDGNTESVLLFGGKKYAGDELVALGELWAWDGSKCKQLGG